MAHQRVNSFPAPPSQTPQPFSPDPFGAGRSSFDPSQFVVGDRGDAEIRIERIVVAVGKPRQTVLVVGMSRVFEDLEQVRVAAGAAAVLWRAGAGAVSTPGIPSARFWRKNLF